MKPGVVLDAGMGKSPRNGVTVRLRRTAWLLLAISLAIPVYLFWNASGTVPVPLDVALPLTVETVRLPVHLAQSTYIPSVVVDGTDYYGAEGCLLNISQDQGMCPPQPVPLGFHWKLLDSRSATVASGTYGDRNAYYQADLGQKTMGGELAYLDHMRRGDYVLELTGLHVPAELAAAHPRLHIEMEDPAWDFDGNFRVLWLLALSAAAFVTGLVLLVVSLIKWARSRRLAAR